MLSDFFTADTATIIDIYIAPHCYIFAGARIYKFDS